MRYIFLITAISLVFGCGKSPNVPSTQTKQHGPKQASKVKNDCSMIQEFSNIHTYPHRMGSNKYKQLKEGLEGIAVGDTRTSVENLIGQPDELMLLYSKDDPKATGNPVGYTCWYVMSRDARYGSVNDKNEDVVRLSYSCEGILTKIDAWGNQGGLMVPGTNAANLGIETGTDPVFDGRLGLPAASGPGIP